MLSPRRKYEFRIHKGMGSPAIIEKVYVLSDKEYFLKYNFWKKFVENELGWEYTFLASQL